MHSVTNLKVVKPVFDLSGVGGGAFNPPLVDDDTPPLVTAKSGLGVSGGRIRPPQKRQKI